MTEKYEIRRGEFGWALEELKRGKLVRRPGWNGKGMFLSFLENKHGEVYTIKRERYSTEYPWANFIVMKTADNMIVPWLASQTDILATDWEHYDDQ